MSACIHRIVTLFRNPDNTLTSDFLSKHCKVHTSDACTLVFALDMRSDKRKSNAY
jgi:hypothetical protein